MRTLALALLCAAWTLAQEADAPEEPEDDRPHPGEIEIEDPGVKIEDPAVARQQVARFKEEMKAAGKDTEARVAALERLGRWDHPQVLQEAKRHIRDSDYKVAVAAVAACARQGDGSKAGPVLLSALKREKRTDVVCALLVGMGRVGYDHRSAYDEAEKWFKRDTTETHKAAARYFGYVRAKEAFRMLAEKLDEPRPARPDDPKNPPASWWRARWFEWQSNAPHVRWALSQLVEGETFETRAEAENWARTEGAKHGIEW